MVSSVDILILSLSIFTTLVTAQTFSIPSTWKNTTSSVPLSDRINAAQAVIDTVTSSYNPSNGLSSGLIFSQSASFLAAVSIFDTNRGIKNYTSFVDNMIDASGNANNGFYLAPLPQMNIDALNWGLASVYAYRVYGIQTLLGHATGVWDETNSHMINEMQAANGSHYEISVPVSRTCNGATVAGGVFPNATQPGAQVNNAVVNADAVTAYMALSAHLYDIVKDPKYQTAAGLIAAFVKNHLYDGEFVLDSIDLGSCSPSATVSTDSQGYFIEGLSVYADTTQDATWTTLLNNLVNASITNAGWTNTDGVNIDGSGFATNDLGTTKRAIFFRGLSQAWNRSPNSSVAPLIESYINVQYSAILRSGGGSNKYSSNWLGSPPTVLQPWSQLSVLDVLATEIKMPIDAQGSPSPTGGNNPSMPENTGNPDPVAKSHTGMIIGIAIGASVLALLTALAIFFFMRRQRSRSHEPRPDLLENTPFSYDSYSTSTANMLPLSTEAMSQRLPTFTTPPPSEIPPTNPPSATQSSYSIPPVQSGSSPNVQTSSPASSYPRDVKAPLPTSGTMHYTNATSDAGTTNYSSSSTSDYVSPQSRFGPSRDSDLPPGYEQ